MKQVHLRLPDEVVDMIEATMEGKSINEKVASFVCSNYITAEFLKLEKTRCLAKMQFIDGYLEKNPFGNIEVLSTREKEFLGETLRLMEADPSKKNNPEFLRSRKSLYQNTLLKNITFKEFELLLYKFKEGSGSK